MTLDYPYTESGFAQTMKLGAANLLVLIFICYTNAFITIQKKILSSKYLNLTLMQIYS